MLFAHACNRARSGAREKEYRTGARRTTKNAFELVRGSARPNDARSVDILLAILSFDNGRNSEDKE
jgi:hypothetical protein